MYEVMVLNLCGVKQQMACNVADLKSTGKMKTFAKGGMIAKALLAGLVVMLFVSAAPQSKANNHKRPLVKICHMRRTIMVDPASVPWHIAHGDHLGSCLADPA